MVYLLMEVCSNIDNPFYWMSLLIINVRLKSIELMTGDHGGLSEYQPHWKLLMEFEVAPEPKYCTGETMDIL